MYLSVQFKRCEASGVSEATPAVADVSKANKATCTTSKNAVAFYSGMAKELKKSILDLGMAAT